MENAIQSWEDLKVGQKVWHVYGIHRPFIQDNLTIASEPRPFREHKGYSDIHEGMGDSIIFDVSNGDYITEHFASDGNLVPGRSYNRNYWFSTEEAAKEALEYFRKNPGPAPVFEDWPEDDYDYGYDEE